MSEAQQLLTKPLIWLEEYRRTLLSELECLYGELLSVDSAVHTKVMLQDFNYVVMCTPQNEFETVSLTTALRNNPSNADLESWQCDGYDINYE